MKDAYKKLIATVMAIYVLSIVKLAMAQDAIISRPVGAGILPGAGTEGADIKSSVVFAKIIPFVITWAINLAVGLSVIAIILGGYLYLTAYGDQDKMDKGKKALFFAIIGLIIALTAYGVVTILTNIQLS